MVWRVAFSVMLSLTLLAVSVVSVAFAAGGEGAPAVVVAPAAAHAHHDMAAEAPAVDCPAQHKGHAVKDTRCVVACFAMFSAALGHGLMWTPAPAEAARGIAFITAFYPMPDTAIPTPPPDFV